jgi:hypothetical protein
MDQGDGTNAEKFANSITSPASQVAEHEAYNSPGFIGNADQLDGPEPASGYRAVQYLFAGLGNLIDWTPSCLFLTSRGRHLVFFYLKRLPAALILVGFRR